jgi:Ca-activated chloride channel family protein
MPAAALGALLLLPCCAPDGPAGRKPQVMPAIPAPSVAVPAPALRNTESYAEREENDFQSVAVRPLSTFSIDVDTASYANTRRFLQDGRLPPADAVRVEEFVNYFHYDYAPPEGGEAFGFHAEAAGCPWSPGRRLVHLGLQTRPMPADERPAANLVFLLDVSGSMSDYNKLPLVKRALKLLVLQLRYRDRLAIVTYAGSAGVALPSTRCGESTRREIIRAIDELGAGGSTAGAEGIRTAYRVAAKHLKDEGANRVILVTDGDFNVGVTDSGDLVDLIRGYAEDNIFLTVYGVGMGNLQDDRLERLANEGNGHYGYIDSLSEARRLLYDELAASVVTIAKDVKIQVEFNPAQVAGYRLIGYENRLLDAADFNDDAKDAGEAGPGHQVTALYEVVPAGAEVPGAGVDDLRYQETRPARAAASNELMLVKLRYKDPEEDVSVRREFVVADGAADLDAVSDDFRFAAAVAGFGMLLGESDHLGKDFGYDDVLAYAQANRGGDPDGLRAEFVSLVRDAQALAATQAALD